MLQPIPNPVPLQMGADMYAPAFLEADQSVRNREAYGALADEYEDPSHATIADFHRLTAALFRRLTTEIRGAMAPVSAGHWLVAGVGTGANVADFLAAVATRPRELSASDLCPEMLAHALDRDVRYDSLVERDLTRKIAIESSGCDAILAFLADPYLDEGGLFALATQLAPAGRLAVTVPSRTWANLVRLGQHPDEAWFNLLDGRRLCAPSFCWNIDDLVALGAKAGLHPLIATEAVHTEAHLESAIIRNAARVVQPQPLNVVTMAVFARD